LRLLHSFLDGDDQRSRPSSAWKLRVSAAGGCQGRPEGPPPLAVSIVDSPLPPKNPHPGARRTGLDGKLIIRRCLLPPRVGKGPSPWRGAKARGARRPARFIILYRLSRMMRGFVRRARPFGIGSAGGDHPSMPRLSPASPSPARAFSASGPPPPGGRRVCRLSRMMRAPGSSPGLNGEVWGWAARRRGRSRAARH